MHLRKKLLITVGFMLLTMVLSVQMAVMQDDIGTEDNPIQVYFVPSVEAGVITTGGEVMAQALEEATGLHFEVSVPTSYAATIEAMCASPENSIGFIPAAGYVIANNRCGVQVGAAAVRNGWPVYWSMYIVPRESDIYVLGDLAGRTWGFGDSASTSGYIAPAVDLANRGIEPGDRVETGGHPQTVLAVYNGDVDFGTVFFSPPLLPGASWQIGDLPEPFDLTVEETFIGDNGNLYVGDVRVLDARQTVRETAPDIVEKVRILALTPPIPNDTMSFGPDFPEETRQEIIDALLAFAETDAWEQSLGSPDFYEWSGLAPIEDAVYDPIRLQFDFLGLTEEDVFGG